MILVFKKISLLFLLLIIPIVLFSQTDTKSNYIETKSDNNSIIENSEPKKKIKKKKKKRNNRNDSIKDSPVSDNIGITRIQWLEMSKDKRNNKIAEWKSLDSAKYKDQYTLNKKERMVLRKRKKNLSVGEKMTYKSAVRKRESFTERIFEGKMQRLEKIIDKNIEKEEWLELSEENQRELMKEWASYDSTMLREKYKYTPEEKKLFSKYDMSSSEKRTLKKAGEKPVKFKKEMTYTSIDNLKRVLKFYQKSRLDTSGFGSMEIQQRHKIVAEHKKIQNLKRAIKRHNTTLKYDAKENRLRDKYKLSLDERKALNKGKSMVLKGDELAYYKRGRRKQDVFSDKLLKLRKKRHNAIQDEKTKKRIKHKEKEKRKNTKDAQKRRKDKVKRKKIDNKKKKRKTK